MNDAARHPIIDVKPRPTALPFRADLIEVVTGTAETHEAGERIARALSERCGHEVRVVDDAAYRGWNVEARRHAVVVGNVGNNAALEYLYHRWLTFVDRAFPGTGGYVLNTLWEPWGRGSAPRPDAIVVGASDPQGLEAAVDRFCSIIGDAADGIPALADVEYGSSLDAERKRVDAWADGGHPRHGWRFPSGQGQLHHVPEFAMLAARSADPRWAAGVRTLLLDLAAEPILDAEPINIHLYLWHVYMAWPLLELSPVYSDVDRLTISRFFYDLLHSSEGVHNPRIDDVRRTPRPRQNHETLCALGIAFAATYFARHYDLPGIDEALATADDVLGFGAVCSKQIEDNNQHGWDQGIGDYATYALLTGKTGFFDNAMARAAMDRAIANCSSNGFIATVGDGTIKRYPRYFLAQTAFYARDPGARFVVENEAPELQGSAGHPVRQTYDAGRAADAPEHHVGTRVFWLDKHYYDVPAVTPGMYSINPPTVPHADTFDVLTMRAGWDKTDQHLVVDGTGGGSHSYEDANAILMLTQDDRFLLVSPDSLHNTAARDHNTVTVSRNGLGSPVPSFSRLDVKADLPTFGFTATTLADYSGTDWTRSIVWRRGDFFLVVDHIVARTRARYGATCRWFGLGEPELADDMCVLHQGEWQGSRTDFVVADLSGSRVLLREAPYGDPDHWKDGYDPRLGPILRTDRTNLTEIHQSQEAELESGENIAFVNLLYARSGQRSTDRIEATPGADGWLLAETADGPYAVRVAAGAAVRSRAPGIDATCRALACGNDTVSAAECTSVQVGVLSVQFSTPCGVEVSASGAVTIDAPAPVSVAWQVAGGRAGILDLPAGVHRRHDIGPLSLPDPHAVFSGQKRSAAPAAAGSSAPSPAPEWSTLLPARANTLHAARLGEGEVLLAGCDDGAIVALGSDGAELWRHLVPGAVNSLHSGPLRAGEAPRIVVGTTDGYTIAVDSSTRQELWRHRTDHGSPFWPWWAWPTAGIVRVHIADLDGDGSAEVIVTAGNMHLLVLDRSGVERWRFRTDHGLFLSYDVVDLDGDGRMEIVGGNDVLASTSQCRVIDSDGTQIHTFENAGWTSQLEDVLVDDLDDDGDVEVACAVNRGENVRVHRLGSPDPLWGRHLGEAPTGLAVLRDDEKRTTLLAVTEGATAIGFDPSGRTRWTVDVPSGVARLVRMDDVAAAIRNDGHIVRVGADGSAAHLGRTHAIPTAATSYRGLVVTAHGDGSVVAFSSAPDAVHPEVRIFADER